MCDFVRDFVVATCIVFVGARRTILQVKCMCTVFISL